MTSLKRCCSPALAEVQGQGSDFASPPCRAARETQALWVLPGRMALQEPLGPLDPQDPQDPQDLPGPLDKDSLRDL